MLKTIGLITGGTFVLLLFVGAFSDPNGSAGPPAASDVPAAVAKIRAGVECKKDLRCWAEKHVSAAGAECRRPIERLAQYQAEWTGSWYEPTFSRYTWRDKEHGWVTYIGDRVKFQNGFGAWRNMVYACDFDPINRRVVNAHVESGRL